MAQWVDNGWAIRTRGDLDRYTFAVAGSVGVLLCDVWEWFDGTELDRNEAARFGRGLQAVNILRNRLEDDARGVNLFPPGWTRHHMEEYARENLRRAETYARTLPPGPMDYFIRIPLALAYATLDALAAGQRKLDRGSAERLMRDLSGVPYNEGTL
jgi:farnesyl-diphosphate farnesyltransferase